MTKHWNIDNLCVSIELNKMRSRDPEEKKSLHITTMRERKRERNKKKAHTRDAIFQIDLLLSQHQQFDSIQQPTKREHRFE